MLNICVSVILNWCRFVCELESITNFSYVLNFQIQSYIQLLFPWSKPTRVHYYRFTEIGVGRKLKRLYCSSLMPQAGSALPIFLISDRCQLTLVLKFCKNYFLISVRNVFLLLITLMYRLKIILMYRLNSDFFFIKQKIKQSQKTFGLPDSHLFPVNSSETRE